MTLSTMIETDEDALICDFAETYNVLNYKALPLNLAATLAVGLRADSRIMLKMSHQKVDYNVILRAAILDRLSFLAWSKTKDAETGKNRPESIVSILMEEPKENDIVAFEDENELMDHIKAIKEAARCQT
jgi:hypothetical protein